MNRKGKQEMIGQWTEDWTKIR